MSDDTSEPDRGISFSKRVPAGDDRPRSVCDHCGHIEYVNPKIVVGTVARFEDKLLMCRRAIDPRKGYWTLPAGYLEQHEATMDGAAREAWEEARAKLEIIGLLGVYNIPRISQVQLIYAAHLTDPAVMPGPESQDVALFGWDEIPWDEIAFPSVHWALGHAREKWDAIGRKQAFTPFGNPPGETGNTPPPGFPGA